MILTLSFQEDFYFRKTKYSHRTKLGEYCMCFDTVSCS